jgi:branched-chain amino acid transport system permease protein
MRNVEANALILKRALLERMLSILKWWAGVLVPFGILGLAGWVLPLPFVIEVLIFSMYTMACNFLLGRLGFISFGQPAYLAAGAYGTAFYLYYFGTNPYFGIAAGILAGFVVSALAGAVFVRLRSDYFALVNLALTVIFFYTLQKVLAPITHGDNGLWFLDRMQNTPVLDLTSPRQLLVFAWLAAVVIWAFYKYLDGTVFGACCLATKTNEDKVKFLGYNDFAIRWTGFVIANTTAAFAGSLYGIYFGFVSPEMASAARAADPVVVTILGGTGTLYGPLVGALAYVGMKDLISRLVGNWEFFVGLLLVTIMLAGEKGIWGTLQPIVQRWAWRWMPEVRE